MKTSQETLRTELTESQRHAAMAEFRARAQRLFEQQRDRVSFLEASIEEQLAALDQGDDEPRETSTEELDDLRSQVAQSRKLLNARASELKQLRSLVAERADGAEEIDVKELLEQLSDLRSERDELIGRLADAEMQVERASAADSEHFDELQRRFEVAVSEIRELKTKNDNLQQQVSQTAAVSHDISHAATADFDWEQQKLRLMQQLDSDLDASNADDKQVKLSIESTIQITDQVIADKDRQITELKALLEEKSERSNESDSSAILDNDEQIREERERLSRLEEEWREKLKQAEIDISVERAKLARERSDVEEKLRTLEDSSRESTGSRTAAKQSGRWLSRLGLKDDDK